MADVWPGMFYQLQNCSAFNTSARVMMLLGFAEHGKVLLKYGQQGAPNWRMQQFAGLLAVALALPELNGSAEWHTVAMANMNHEMVAEVYSDGVETGL